MKKYLKHLKYLGLFLLGLICIGSMILAIIDPTTTVTIKEKEAQLLVDERLPFTTTVPFKIPFIKEKKAHVNIKNVVIDFLETEKVSIQSDLIISSEGRLIKGNIKSEAKVVYRSGSFYLHDVNINDINIDKYKVTEKDQKLIQSAINIEKKGKSAILAFNKFIKKEDKGGSLENGISEKKIEETLLKIKNSLMLKSKDLFLEKLHNTPIYKLNGDDYKQNIAKLMLNDIKFNKDSLDITMSVSKLISTVWLYVISAIFGFIFLIGVLFAFLGAGLGASRSSMFSFGD